MCVHTRHCCVRHGCKYGEEDSCPVWLGYVNQENPCEQCNTELPSRPEKKILDQRVAEAKDMP